MENQWKKRKASLRQYQIGAPFERLAMDIMSPSPESNDGNRYILVVRDYLTKWTEAFVIPNQEACTVADRLVEEVICRYSGIFRAQL